jgi:predicted nucleotidyltransferase component of viral defense system
MVDSWSQRVLEAVVLDELLRDRLILRGGGALWLFHSGTRPAGDLDFLVLNLHGQQGVELLETCRGALNGALNRAAPEDAAERERFRQAVRVDLSLAQSVCQCSPMPITDSAGETRYLKVCTLEEIVAEKLVAMLDPGEKSREQDLYDVAAVMRFGPRRPELSMVAMLAAKKAGRRHVTWEPAAFSEQVRKRLAANYDRLRDSTGKYFIPLEDAWRDAMALIPSIAP